MLELALAPTIVSNTVLSLLVLISPGVTKGPNWRKMSGVAFNCTAYNDAYNQHRKRTSFEQ